MNIALIVGGVVVLAIIGLVIARVMRKPEVVVPVDPSTIPVRDPGAPPAPVLSRNPNGDTQGN